MTRPRWDRAGSEDPGRVGESHRECCRDIKLPVVSGESGAGDVAGLVVALLAELHLIKLDGLVLRPPQPRDVSILLGVHGIKLVFVCLIVNGKPGACDGPRFVYVFFRRLHPIGVARKKRAPGGIGECLGTPCDDHTGLLLFHMEFHIRTYPSVVGS